MYNFTVLVQKEDKYYVAHNLDLGIVSQGLSHEESITNLKEATKLYLEDETVNSIDKKILDNNYFLTNIKV
ncbi:MAG: type II toxin-antitoxin system HicB family antitoxin [Candidatus Gracilibacteria bacterium]|nr:type II toxin-antitoxin system HicB family antitoxin [Candidatus Gracilibacteria bacterium]